MHQSELTVVLALSVGLMTVNAGSVFTPDHSHTQVASMSGTDWLQWIELLKSDQATPNKKPWVPAEVLKVEAAGNQITISHKAIESIATPAMTMTFRVKDSSHLRMVKAEDKVQLHPANLVGVVSVVDLRMQH